MGRDTTELIRSLAAAAAPVRPLARPWTRAAIWCAASLPYLWLLYLAWPRHLGSVPIDRSFLIEQAAALATGLTAAAAAFATVVPGYSRLIGLTPVIPLALWLGHLGRLCVRDWSASADLPNILIHWACLPATAVAGIVPAVVMVVMLRRGAPMTPRLTTAFGALAVAGIGNLGVRFLHPLDASFVILAWHIVAVFALSAIATLFGTHVFNWRRLVTRVGVGA